VNPHGCFRSSCHRLDDLSLISSLGDVSPDSDTITASDDTTGNTWRTSGFSCPLQPFWLGNHLILQSMITTSILIEEELTFTDIGRKG
jgi:hypothetical protein